MSNQTTTKARTAPLHRWWREWRTRNDRGIHAPWSTFLLPKLVRWINKYCFNGRAITGVIGPCGLACRCYLQFSVDGKQYEMTVEPVLHTKGLYWRRTLWGKKKEGVDFPPGSIGAVNQLATDTEDFPARPDADWFMSRFSVSDVKATKQE